MKAIPLTQGCETIVDDEDYDKVNRKKWWASPNGYTYYARCRINKKREFLHRFILDILDKPEFQVDHINMNGLDNRRCNLRIATHAQNRINSRKTLFINGKPATSKYKGVHQKKHNKYWWHAAAKYKGKQYSLGSYKTEEEAALAYNKFAEENFGEFARLNKI